jgi:CheY-like chemotaxis protein
LQQILTSLVGNALGTTARGEVVLHVQLERQAPQEVWLRFAIQDASGGVSAEEKQLVAEALLESAAGKPIPPTGSSRRLLIAAQLVGQLGGRLRMVTVPGAGNTFHFTIVFGHTAKTAVPSQQSFDEPPASSATTLRLAGTGRRILLVEDDSINQKVASFMLKKRGHEVEVASSGADGLAALSRETFDLVLMDIRMPGMDGFEAAARIRQDEQGTGRHIPIVALTAQALPGDREKCLAAGMDGYISKPIQTAELHATIDAVLSGGGTAAEVAAWGNVAQSAWGLSRPAADEHAVPVISAANIA